MKVCYYTDMKQQTHTLTLLVSGKSYMLENMLPRSVREALHDLGLEGISFPCGGHGVCGKCLVRQISGTIPEPSEHDLHHLSEDRLKAGYRLGCSLQIPCRENVTLVLGEEEQNEHVLTTYLEDQKADLFISGTYGFAVDVGTTTIVVYLVDRASATVLGTLAAMNHQRMYGGDVIARIQYASETEGGVSRLHTTLVAQLCSMIETLLHEHGLSSQSVDELVVVGNPTMMHFLSRENPASLAVAPFSPVFVEPKILEGTLLSLPNARVLIPGLVSAYIGSDITVGLHATNILDEQKGALYIDIGTNGEIALYNGSELFSCSSAAGPAFEGASILHGMSALGGAIDHVWLSDDGSVAFSTIGEEPAKGICGSGIIDCVALMLGLHLIDETGAINGEHPEFARYMQEGPVLRLTDTVVFTARDVREVQLAKAAIAAGVQVLLEEAGMALSAIHTLYLAGGFGSFINTQKAQQIGLLPLLPEQSIRTVGNAAGKGALCILTQSKGWQEVETIRRSMHYHELSSSAAFQNHFIDQMLFAGEGL